MLLKSAFKLSLAIFPFFANAQEIPRLGKISFNKSEVQKVFIAEGRSTILKFPCNVKTYSAGPTNDIEAALNDRDSQLLEVWLGKIKAQPAGLKVFCNESFFAFDIVPSTIQHQDVLEIKSSYGTPKTISKNLNIEKSKIIASSNSKPSSNKMKIIRVISSSQGAQNEK